MLIGAFYYSIVIVAALISTAGTDPTGSSLTEFIYPSGSTFQLTCHSYDRIRWRLPLSPEIKGEHYDLINRTSVETSPVYRYRGASTKSTITVTNTTYLDTGLYVCTQEANGYSVIAEFYVFIEDDHHLLLSNNETIVVEHEEPRTPIIPCLPTHPSVSVELVERKSTTLHLATGWTYDPRKGFSGNDGITVKYYEQWLECHAVRNLSTGSTEAQQSIGGVLGNVVEGVQIRIAPKGLVPSVTSAHAEIQGSRPIVQKPGEAFELPFYVASFTGFLNISVLVRDCPPSGFCNSSWEKLYRVLLGNDMELESQMFAEAARNGEHVTHSRIRNQDREIQVHSVYINGFANVSRTYLCTACNTYNCSMPGNRGNTVLGISDLEDGITLEATPQSPYTVDTVNITCTINLFYFRQPITWKYNELQIRPSGMPFATTSPYAYAERLSIRFDHSFMYRDNKYTCNGVPLDETSATTRTIKIEWKVPEVPKIYQYTPEDKLIEVDGNFTQLIKLKCVGTGNPHPSISWKTDEDILPNDSFSIVGNTTTLSLHRVTISESRNYTCVYSNSFGEASETFQVVIPEFIEDETTSLALYAGLSVFLVLVAAAAIVTFLACRRKNEAPLMPEEFVKFDAGDPSALNPELSIDQQADLLPYDPRWEFPRNRLTLGKLLGAGAFGRVYQAEAVGISDSEPVSIVAVKTVKTRSEAALKSLIAELKIMIHLGSHLNVLNLLGACTRDLKKGELFIILEYCRYGNLRSYLFTYSESFIDEAVTKSTTSSLNRKIEAFSTSDLLCWAYQIARGMVYLAERKVIHGDLAARNIFLTEERIVKVGDFGLARDVFASGYYKKKANDPLPLKWMAPEAILKRKFTSQSDVWSYGIVLWELCTLGTTPYPGLEADESLVRKIAHGYRLEKPIYSPQSVYDIMLKCWSFEPTKRPSFSALEEKMGNHIEESIRGHYIELNAPYVEMNQVRLAEGPDYMSMMSGPTHLTRLNHSNYVNDPVETGRIASHYDRLRVDIDGGNQYLKMTADVSGNERFDSNKCTVVSSLEPSVRYTKM